MDIEGIVTVYIARMTLPYALLILEDLSSITPYHSWIDSDQESHETLVKLLPCVLYLSHYFRLRLKLVICLE